LAFGMNIISYSKFWKHLTKKAEKNVNFDENIGIASEEAALILMDNLSVIKEFSDYL
jgi:hypothetical protein